MRYHFTNKMVFGPMLSFFLTERMMPHGLLMNNPSHGLTNWNRVPLRTTTGPGSLPRTDRTLFTAYLYWVPWEGLMYNYRHNQSTSTILLIPTAFSHAIIMIMPIAKINSSMATSLASYLQLTPKTFPFPALLPCYLFIILVDIHIKY